MLAARRFERDAGYALASRPTDRAKGLITTISTNQLKNGREP